MTKKGEVNGCCLVGLLCAAAGCLLASCGGKGISQDDLQEVFNAPQTLAADSIAVGQILRPVEMQVLGDKMIISSSGTDSAFYVYSLPDFRFLYPGVRMGGGPGDLQQGGAFQKNVSADGSEFFVGDLFGRRLRVYSLSQESMQGGEMSVFRNRGVWPRFFLDRGRALMETSPEPDGRGSRLLAVSGDSLQRVSDSLATLSVRIPIGGGGVQSLNNCLVGAVGDAVAVGYGLIPRMEFYRLDARGRFERLAGWGDSLYVPKVSDVKEGADLEDAVIYYWDVQASGKHFYALYRGQTEAEYAETPYNIIRVFALDGSPVKALQIDGGYGLFAVDEARRRIYAVDGEKDFEYVYVFRYEL